MKLVEGITGFLERAGGGARDRFDQDIVFMYAIVKEEIKCKRFCIQHSLTFSTE